MTETQFEGNVPIWTEGDRLGKALRHADISNQGMAEYLGVSRNTVGNYIAGRTPVDKRTRMLWALRTGVAIDWLENGDSAPTPPPNGGGEPTSVQSEALAKLAASKRSTTRRATTHGYLSPAAA